MMKKMCKSSEVYLVEKADILTLPVALDETLPQTEVAVLLGDENRGTADTLIAGLDLLDKDESAEIPVRFYFRHTVRIFRTCSFGIIHIHAFYIKFEERS